MFGESPERKRGNARALDWIKLRPISAIALLDADAYSRVPIILHGLVGLREILTETARALFPDAQEDAIVKLTAKKYQLLAVVDTNAGLTVDRLGSAIKSFCSDQGFDLVESDSEGLGVCGTLSSMLTSTGSIGTA